MIKLPHVRCILVLQEAVSKLITIITKPYDRVALPESKNQTFRAEVTLNPTPGNDKYRLPPLHYIHINFMETYPQLVTEISQIL
jgi:hypothetical protein